MKAKAFTIIILVLLLLNGSGLAASPTSTLDAPNLEKNSAAKTSTVKTQNIPEKSNPQSHLTVYTASGKTENLSFPFEVNRMEAVNIGNSTTIFVNDLFGGQKIDISLQNYTMLKDEGYLLNGEKLRVIALTGNMIRDDAYAIRALTEPENSALTQIVQHVNGTILSKQDTLPYYTLEIPYENLATISQCNMISHIFLDKKHKVCLSESVPLIKPPEKWLQIEYNFGFQINGSGTKIAILDTGIDSTHPDLQGKVVLEQCFTYEGKTGDGFGHGTHCASIAAGTGAASNYAYVGVAPGALLLNGKVLTDAGWGYVSWIINGIAWAVEQGGEVISMSFGDGLNGDGTDPMSIAIDWATDQGVVCVVAAGNDGGSGMSSVGSPGVAKKAITVGASTKDDILASFSSQGPTTDLRLKPDVCAPGVDIVAARATGTSMGDPINEYYTMASGTSMATPHVAGAVALIRQAHPDWSPIMVKSALMENARILEGEHLWEEGAGRIDVCQAVNSTLLVIEPSASFGIVAFEPLDKSFTLMSTVDYEQNVDLSTLTTCEGIETDYVSLSESSLDVPARGEVSVTMTVGPLDYEAPEGWYEGLFKIMTSGRIYDAPYLFTSSSAIEVSMYDVDNSTRIAAQIMLAGYPDTYAIDSDWCYSWGSYYPTFNVKSGNYSICATSGWIEGGIPYGSGFERAFMLQKVVSVPKFSKVHARLTLADAVVSEVPTVDSEGHNLVTHAYSQYFSGGNTHSYNDEMSWSIQFMWLNVDLNDSKRIFYSSCYTPANELSEAFGFFASSDLMMSDVYLLDWKFFNVPVLPSVLKYEASYLASYKVTYDIPETNPSEGISIGDAFWFTWKAMGWMQSWFWEFHKVPPGIEATFHLTPSIAWYYGFYMPTYWPTYPLNGLAEEWLIGSFDAPPVPRETGTKRLGRYNFGPYVPKIRLSTSCNDGQCVVNISGSLWANLERPRSWILFEYPPTLPYYCLYVDGNLAEQGNLGSWTDVYHSWAVTGERGLLEIYMPSLATISKQTIYSVNFSLTQDLNLPPLFYDLIMPLNYAPGESITILPQIPSTPSFQIISLSLSYSFDGGSTWQNGRPVPYIPGAFTVACEEFDELAILIKATDKNGNSFRYYSSPVALCKKVTLDVDLTASSAVIRGATVNGNPLFGFAVRIDAASGSFYVVLDSMGQAILPAAMVPFTAWFPTVGLYAGTLAPKPDVAIVDIGLSPADCYIGKIVNVSVTARNYGWVSESFMVKAYCGGILFGESMIEELGAGADRTVVFRLDTSILVPYMNISVKAEASAIAYETNLENNVLIKGDLRIRVLGDVNGDRKIDIFDVVYIVNCYGSKQGDPQYDLFADLAPEWGKIDIFDVVTCLSHYGEKY